jgi:hypothetical protein
MYGPALFTLYTTDVSSALALTFPTSNSVTKTTNIQGQTTCRTIESYPYNSCFVTVKLTKINTYAEIGIQNADKSYEFLFLIYRYPTVKLIAYDSGDQGFSPNYSWSENDILTIAATSSSICYYKNGEYLFSTTLDPNKRALNGYFLLTDVSDSLTNVAFGYSSSGQTGSTGPQGYQGFTGYQGFQGFTGYQGFQGFTGSTGPQGFQGFQGFTGTTGRTGPQGFTGYQGFQGFTGSTGPQGFQGSTGPQGFQGFQGFTGYQGFQGFTGSTGPQGFQGFTGYTGRTGPQGFQGFTGPAGGGGGTTLPNAVNYSNYVFWNGTAYTYGGESFVAIGSQAGKVSQGLDAIAIGKNAGYNTLGTKSIAIGYQAGFSSLGDYSIAIGYRAAYDDYQNVQQQHNTIVLNANGSYLSASTESAFYASPIRNDTAANVLYYNISTSEIVQSDTLQTVPKGSSYSDYLYWNSNTLSWNIGSSDSVHIGSGAGSEYNQGNTIAIGFESGYYTQGQQSMAIGYQAGKEGQDVHNVAIGYKAGTLQQRSNCVAIGHQAGSEGQKVGAIAIGSACGQYDQGEFSIAIGHQAGSVGQKVGAIAIGSSCGQNDQGEFSIAIGYNTGTNQQLNHTIILNSTGFGLNSATENAFYAAPIRNDSETTTDIYVLEYNTTTSEITRGSKTFVIDHPKDENKYLVHACLEGPEAGVYYRGEGEITNNISTTILLPDYVDKLASSFNTQVTPVYDGKVKCFAATEIKNNKFEVYGENGRFHWLVHGKRLNIDVEPTKSKTNVKGAGPYKWIE